MNKSRRKVNRFVNGLFEQHGVPRIPVYLHWYSRILVINDNPCFGLFMGNPDNEKEICIHSVAGTKYGTDATMKIIAHEFAHYLQYLYDRDRLDNNIEEMEEEAEAYGQELVQKFIDKRNARIWAKDEAFCETEIQWRDRHGVILRVDMQNSPYCPNCGAKMERSEE